MDGRREQLYGERRAAERNGSIARRGLFFWRKDASCDPRSRAAVGGPGDRIAPEEYAEVVNRVLSGGVSFTRPALITEVRAVLGYNRTGPVLEQAIGSVVDQMLADAVLGEGSAGLLLRQPVVPKYPHGGDGLPGQDG